MLKVFHKPTCITCKKTILELEKMKVNLEARDFFKEPFSEKELRTIITKAKIKPKDMLRKKDKMYKELNLETSKKTDAQLIKLMIQYPGLIKRPIIISKNKITVGKVDVKEL